MMNYSLSPSQTRPILKWAGGKSKLLPSLIPLFPSKAHRYIEPFMGGGAVFFGLNFEGQSLLNDFNHELISLYEVVRDHPELLMKSLDKLSNHYSEEYFYQLRSQNLKSKIESAARTIFLNKCGYNGLYRQNSKGEFNVPFGKRLKCPALYKSSNLLNASQSLQNTRLTSIDFESLIDQAKKGDFIYCDPPYEPLSKTSSFNTYQGVGFTQKDQIRLKESCLRAQERGAWSVISNSSAEFIKDLYKDCQIETIKAKRSINSKGQNRGEIDELVIIMKPHDVTSYKNIEND